MGAPFFLEPLSLQRKGDFFEPSGPVFLFGFGSFMPLLLFLSADAIDTRALFDNVFASFATVSAIFP